MAAPILKIPIDDAAFKKFVSTFEKYQSELKDQPAIWKEIGASVSEFASAGAEFAENLAKQTSETIKLADEEEKRENAKRRAESASEKAARTQAKLEEEAKKRREEATAQVKKYASAMADMITTSAKWTFGGGALGFAASGFGLGELGGWAGDERRAAQGIGTSIGGRQRAQVSLGRYVDTDSAINRIAGMQADPSMQGAFTSMGVGFKGRDPARVLEDAAMAAARLYKKYQGNPDVMRALGVSNIFSENEQRTLANLPKGELRQTIAGAPNLNLSDKSARAWQGFLAKLDEASFKIKDALSDKLSALAGQNGPLSKLTDSITYFITKALSESNIDWIAKGIENFADVLNSPSFKKTFDETVETVGRLGRKIAWLVDKIPMPDGGKSSVATDYSTGFDNGASRLSKIVGGITAKNQAGQNIGHYAGYDEKINRDIAGTYLSSKGWTDPQVRGLLASGQGESRFDPLIWGDPDKKTGKMTAFGYAQWHKPRRDVFAAITGHRMEDTKDPARALGEQLWFQNWELTSNDKRNIYKKAGDRLKQQTTDYAAAGVVSQYYEGPKDVQGNIANRGLAAMNMRWSPNITVTNFSGSDVNVSAVNANSAAGH